MAHMDGMNEHKKMAGAGMSGNFGVCDYPGSKGTTHVAPSVGEMKHLGDGERGVGMNVKGGEGRAFGRQAAPKHGPMPDHFSREGKV